MAQVGHFCTRLLEHFAEHGRVQALPDGNTVVTFDDDMQLLMAASQATHVSIWLGASTAGALALMKTAFAEHVMALAPPSSPPPHLHWADAKSVDTPLPQLQIAYVVQSERITPRMQRLTLACPQTQALLGPGHHVRLLMPSVGRTPCWPRQAPDGRICWPQGDDALLRRVYTLREVDLTQDRVTLDIVLHSQGDPSAGGQFVIRAKPGDAVGLLGPGGGGTPQAQRLLLLGDETALPAIARILADLPSTSRVHVCLEVANAQECQDLPPHPGLSVQWMLRMGEPAGEPGRLERALLHHRDHGAAWAHDPDCFVWAACEQAVSLRLRQHLLARRGADRSGYRITAYWQRGPESQLDAR